MPVTETRNETVSGWTNYETFHVALFLSNNRPPYEQAMDLARGALTGRGVPPDLTDTLWLADALESLVEGQWLEVDDREEACRTDQDYLAHALLTAALVRVNWREIAEDWLNTARENTR